MQRILIVEDDPVICSLMVEFLSDEGFTVLTAADGGEGIALAETERPDLVLMDLMLPLVDGISATRALKANAATRYIPVVAISAGTNLTADRDRLPADGVVAKPFDLETLLATVRRFIEAGAPQPEQAVAGG